MTEDMGLQQDEMQEIIDDFLVEADELINSLDNNFVKLESAPEDLDLLNEIFRAAHTIKGTSSFLGFEQVTTLTHRMEDILNRLRKSEMAVTSNVMDALLDSLDLLKVLLNNVRQGNDEELDLTDILARLNTFLEADNSEKEEPTSTEQVTEEPQPQEPEQAAIENPPPVQSGQTPPEAVSLQVPTSKQEQQSRESNKDQQKSEPDTPPATVPKTTSSKTQPAATGKKKSVEQTIRVDVTRLDTLMNMMGELVLGRNSLLQALNKLNAEHEGKWELESVNQAATSVNFITTELQMAVMKMRMQPIGKVFNRFPRLVRDLARETKKKIQLKIIGEGTELDKSVIEEIGDPLVHIIRNSCDHGLETPEERIAAGKPETGTVMLEASQEGSNIVIKITDDGRGFDVAAIRDKAVERGLASREEVDKMPDREVYKFIFQAGFSTAKVITDVSGRGVGMDVVRSNIEKLNGIIELDSTMGKGTAITIKLPLTLAIIQGLLVQSDNEVLILPLSAVSETVKTEHSDIYYVSKRPVLRLRDEIIPLLNVVDVLKGNTGGLVLAEKPYIVIVGLAEKKLGLIVDQFLGQEEVVIKSLGSYLGTTEGIAGATILGDGRIRLIVDIIGLFNIAKRLN